MDNCIFCKIINGEIPASTIYENSEFKVILDRFPSNPGHVLVLPKEHCANIFEISPDKAGRLFALATTIAKELKSTLGFENMNVLQNNGEIAGQSVNHFHLHLIPRYADDKININWPPLSPTDEEMLAMQEKLKINL